MLFKKQTKSEVELQRLYKELETCEPGSEYYNMVLDSIERLETVKNKAVKGKIDPAIVAAAITATASVASVALICNYEKVNVLTSKAVNFVKK